MADCELTAKCIFFNDQMANMPAFSKLVKKRYCLGDNSICARYKVFNALGREKVPKDLFPVDMNRAEQIISNGYKPLWGRLRR